jgi:hypothetical protein
VKLLLALAALMLAIGAVGFWVWRSAPEPEPCAVRVFQELRSPDGRALAEAFEQRCEASLTTHVTLRGAAAPLPARTDVFVAGGAVPVGLRWASGALQISSKARPLSQESSWRGVAVHVRQQ